MSRMRWRPLPGYSRAVLKRSDTIFFLRSGRRRGAICPAVFLCLIPALIALGSCVPAPETAPLNIMVTPMPGRGGVELLALWEGLGELAGEVGPEGLLNYQLEYQIILRNREIFAGRKSMGYSAEIGYDPFNKVYYLLGPGEQRIVSEDPERFARALAQPMVLTVPAAELTELGWGTFEITLEIRSHHRASDPAFGRWLVLFSNYRRRASGETEFPWLPAEGNEL